MFVLFIVFVAYENVDMISEVLMAETNEQVEEMARTWIFENVCKYLDENISKEKWEQICTNKTLEDISRYLYDYNYDITTEIQIRRYTH